MPKMAVGAAVLAVDLAAVPQLGLVVLLIAAAAVMLALLAVSTGTLAVHILLRLKNPTGRSDSTGQDTDR